MRQFEYLNIKMDDIKLQVRLGITRCNIINHFAVYSRYDYYRKLGNKKSKSVIFTSIDYDLSEVIIYKIVNEMESEI